MKLYKYRRWNDWTKTILETREFWASCPDRFNDPFDCLPQFDGTVSLVDFRRKIEEDVARASPQSTPVERGNIVDEYVQQHWPPTREELQQHQNDYAERVRRVGVIAFSERWDSILMWSHYADEHRGICIEVDTDAFSECPACRPVHYEKVRPRINLFRDGPDVHRLAALVKKADWSYEREWRFTLEATAQSGPLPQGVRFPEGAITGVLLGERAAPEHELEVARLIAKLAPRPKLYRAFLHAERFAMNRRVLAVLEQLAAP